MRIMGHPVLLVGFLSCGLLVRAQKPPDPPPPGSIAQNPPDTGQLPDAPSPQAQSPIAKISPSGKLPAILAPQITRYRLTARDKRIVYFHQATNPIAMLTPALGAAITMADPPSLYPHEWRDGGQAFARNYGDHLARRQSEKLAQFVTQLAFHEDPRYVPSRSRSHLHRMYHALVFTVVNRRDSGENRMAYSNFTGAAASGFIGMTYLPPGYNDTSHALQRAVSSFTDYATGNIANEYCPEWGGFVMKLHIPYVHPPCEHEIRAKHAKQPGAQQSSPESDKPRLVGRSGVPEISENSSISKRPPQLPATSNR